ncbi:MAG: helix-turn-helix transcriptional regulator [Pseudonocardiaceae bacterium]
MRRHIGDRPYRSAAELIRALRDDYLLTQGELAGRTGLSRHQLCRWEKGTRQPPLDALRRILAEFDSRSPLAWSRGPLSSTSVWSWAWTR